MDGEEGLSSNRTTSTNNSTYADEEDSDEEKFEKDVAYHFGVGISTARFAPGM
jgi:hypothetical protein